MEGLERVWGTGTKGLEGTKTQGEGGGKNEATVERDTREHRGGWQRGSARRGNRGGGGVETGERGGEIRLARPLPSKPRLVPTTTVLAVATAQRLQGSPSFFIPPLHRPLPSPRARHLPLRPARPSAHDRSKVRRYVRRLADVTRLMLARTRAEDDPRALYTRGEVGRLDGLG